MIAVNRCGLELDRDAVERAHLGLAAAVHLHGVDGVRGDDRQGLRAWIRARDDMAYRLRTSGGPVRPEPHEFSRLQPRHPVAGQTRDQGPVHAGPVVSESGRGPLPARGCRCRTGAPLACAHRRGEPCAGRALTSCTSRTRRWRLCRICTARTCRSSRPGPARSRHGSRPCCAGFAARTGAVGELPVRARPACRTLLDARLAAGDPPDVALLPQPGLLRRYATSGRLMPLDRATTQLVQQRLLTRLAVPRIGRWPAVRRVVQGGEQVAAVVRRRRVRAGRHRSAGRAARAARYRADPAGERDRAVLRRRR